MKQQTKQKPEKKRSSKKQQAKIKKTTQDTIPVLSVYKDGLFLEEGNIFSKLYRFDDIAFTIKSNESQEAIMKSFEEMLSALPVECTVKFSAATLKTDTEQRFLEVASQSFGDSLNEYREAYNELIRSKMTASEVSTKKYITISVKESDMTKAQSMLANIEGVLRDMMVSLETQMYLVSSEERLELLQKIFNQSEKNYSFEHENGTTRLDFKKLAKQGLSFKDVIAPSYLSFKARNFAINDNMGQSLYISNLPNKLSTRFYAELSSCPFEGVTTYYIHPKSAKEASKIIRDLNVGVQTEMEGKGANKKTSAMSDELDAWASDLGERDQKMFEFDLCVTHFAPDKETLKAQEAKIRNSADKYICSVVPCIMQQERGFLTSLPLGSVSSHTSRYITTEALGLFQPFDEINTFQEGGFYYGINAVNENVVVINKMRNDNYNSVILGSSGSGKSFATKQEMTAVILNKPTASVFILDPEGEYCDMVRKFGGEVIKISPQSNTGGQTETHVHINACDLDIDKSLDSSLDPIAMKTDFLCGLLEAMIGKGASLDAEQIAIVTRCVDLMYEPYIQHLATLPPVDGHSVTIDRQFCPTLQKLFDLLLEQPEPVAQRLARIMQPYVTGIYSIFAHTTNVNVENRIICYDISGISDRMTDLALKVCLDDFWNRTIANRRKGRVTYIYADEAHRFFANPTSADYFEQFWRRLRKWSGVPTAITQNVSDLLVNPKASLLLTQSSNILILKQAEREQMLLSELLKLQPSELAYIKKPKPGSGLIVNNGFVIPFVNDFPQDNPLYPVFCTREKTKKDAQQS